MRDSQQAAGRRRLSNRARRLAMVASLLVVAVGEAGAGGLSLYEVGTADVGLASAGYGARAQDASTVLTNPAGMTRLAATRSAGFPAAASSSRSRFRPT